MPEAGGMAAIQEHLAMAYFLNRGKQFRFTGRQHYSIYLKSRGLAVVAEASRKSLPYALSGYKKLVISKGRENSGRAVLPVPSFKERRATFPAASRCAVSQYKPIEWGALRSSVEGLNIYIGATLSTQLVDGPVPGPYLMDTVFIFRKSKTTRMQDDLLHFKVFPRKRPGTEAVDQLPSAPVHSNHPPDPPGFAGSYGPGDAPMAPLPLATPVYTHRPC